MLLASTAWSFPWLTQLTNGVRKCCWLQPLGPIHDWPNWPISIGIDCPNNTKCRFTAQDFLNVTYTPCVQSVQAGFLEVISSKTDHEGLRTLQKGKIYQVISPKQCDPLTSNSSLGVSQGHPGLGPGASSGGLSLDASIRNAALNLGGGGALDSPLGSLGSWWWNGRWLGKQWNHV
jgi:hypothetical protein